MQNAVDTRRATSQKAGSWTKRNQHFPSECIHRLLSGQPQELAYESLISLTWRINMPVILRMLN